MDHQHPLKALEVFEAAVACAPDEQQALLDERCGADVELRAEVTSLLQHDAKASVDFMRPCKTRDLLKNDQTGHDAARRVGQCIGKYTIRSVIATGGMGDVYLAEQQRPQREVALKMMRLGATTHGGLRRFEYESEVLAHLKHPNIAQIYEAGAHDEELPTGHQQIPYFAMEYIDDALPITEYAAEHDLNTHGRLRLFAQACNAVHHGHEKGIIHRDLKPANILVDATGNVKIIDFGIARSTDADVAVTTMRTGAGELVGTLQYMSPEQCDANPHDIDTRSDVYSLGVVLYEFLTGSMPYEASRTTIYGAIQTIKEQEPLNPTAVNHRLRGGVEMIVLKALKKDRDQRYSTAGELAADIQRHLDGKPIEARPPTTWWRAKRWMSRHPYVTTGTACTFLAAVILLGSYSAVLFTRSIPHILVRADGSGQTVQLFSLDGNVLRVWGTETVFGISFAHHNLIDRPVSLGGGRMALLGFNKAWDMEYPDSLVAYNVDRDLTHPEWTRCIKPKDVFPDPHNRNYRAEQFGVCLGAVFDIFEESPGPEIVSVHRVRRYSQSIIRIYNLRGEVLYEVWHDGVLSGREWMAESRLLVFSGSNDERGWNVLGYPEVGVGHPSVVFAIRPRFGSITHGFLSTTPGDGALQPAWYLVGMPPLSCSVHVRRPWMESPTRAVGVDLHLISDAEATCFWDLDGHGQEMLSSRETNDSFKNHADQLPDADAFQLVPYDSLLKDATTE